MNTSKVINHIVNWLKSYSIKSKTNGFVVGISGGIDSAVTSTLACMTGLPTLCIQMPIYQSKNELLRSGKHIKWINKFKNSKEKYIDLTETFESFSKSVAKDHKNDDLLSLANSRSRLRMTTLYYHATLNNYLVVGTGNKVEDFGVGFYTKYGDGGVDLSPIADLMKSQVRAIAKELNIIDEIIKAKPTDGLWDDTRSDEDQIGATYDELEKAMELKNKKISPDTLEGRSLEVYNILDNFYNKNQHKMIPIPICKIPKELLNNSI